MLSKLKQHPEQKLRSVGSCPAAFQMRHVRASALRRVRHNDAKRQLHVRQAVGALL